MPVSQCIAREMQIPHSAWIKKEIIISSSSGKVSFFLPTSFLKLIAALSAYLKVYVVKEIIISGCHSGINIHPAHSQCLALFCEFTRVARLFLASGGGTQGTIWESSSVDTEHVQCDVTQK